MDTILFSSPDSLTYVLNLDTEQNATFDGDVNVQGEDINFSIKN